METVLLNSAHLTLRNFRKSDFEAVLAYWSDPDVCRYIGEPRSPQEVEAHLARFEKGWSRAEGETLRLAVTLRDEGTVVGEVKLHYLSVSQRQAECGVALNPRRPHPATAGGQPRLGLEAYVALLRYAFEELGLHRVIGFVDVENKACLRMIQHLGMRCEGVLRKNTYRRGEWRDEYLTAFLDDEWFSIRQRLEPLLVPTPRT